MNILAIDLGKFKSVACLYRSDDDVAYRTIETRPQAVHDLLTDLNPDRLVVEVGTVTGWVYDLAEARTAVFQYAEKFYTRQRQHSSLGYASPELLSARLLLPARLSTSPGKGQLLFCGGC